jgi:hypothetical protein
MPTPLASPSSSPILVNFTRLHTTPTTITILLPALTSSSGMPTRLLVATTGCMVRQRAITTHSCLWLTHATPQRHTTSSVWRRLDPTTQTPPLDSTSTTTTVLQPSLQVVVPLNSGSHLPSGHRVSSYFFSFCFSFVHHYILFTFCRYHARHRHLTGYNSVDQPTNPFCIIFSI